MTIFLKKLRDMICDKDSTKFKKKCKRLSPPYAHR